MRLLVEQGVDVWFDEWELRPGDSIVGGIEEGLSNAGVAAARGEKAGGDERGVYGGR